MAKPRTAGIAARNVASYLLFTLNLSVMEAILSSTPTVGTKVISRAASGKRWLVIYTRPRWEKKVHQQLQMQGIESYCPLRKVLSQWADRKKTVELPLFSSYVFVKVDLKEELRVRQTLGVLNFIYYMGKPATIRECDIEQIRELLAAWSDLEVVSLEEISVGDRVYIKTGAFNNQQGCVIDIKGKNVLMVLDNLKCALVTKIRVENVAIVQN